MNKFYKKLEALKTKDRYRFLRLPSGIDFSSNDYLGMRNHPKLRAAAIQALQSGMAMGAGGSRLLRGHMQEHEELEVYAAQCFGSERALFFANGFQANYAFFTTLPDRHDVIIYDEYVHASMREGINSSYAKSIKVKHNDLNAFEDALKKITAQRSAAQNEDSNIWIAIESVYSMEGDIAPLNSLCDLAQRYEAFLIIDEAHATGIFGSEGYGLSRDIRYEKIISIHTCGKALGVSGGLICASTDIINIIINTSRPFIYSTATPPIQAFLVKKSLEILSQEPERRKSLLDLILYSKTINFVSKTNSQIIPVIMGEDERTLQIAQKLQMAGYDVRAIRPPTVPEGTARLRISLNTSLDHKTISDFFECLNLSLNEK